MENFQGFGFCLGQCLGLRSTGIEVIPFPDRSSPFQYSDGSCHVTLPNFQSNSNYRVTRELRDIAARYPELDIVTYQQSRAIADQLNVILPSTIQNDSLAIICMVIIALLFIPNPLCSLWITVAIITIDIG